MISNFFQSDLSNPPEGNNSDNNKNNNLSPTDSPSDKQIAKTALDLNTVGLTNSSVETREETGGINGSGDPFSSPLSDNLKSPLFGKGAEVEENKANPNIIAPDLALSLSSEVRKKSSLPERAANYWKQLSLRRKATLLALAVGVTPILAVGGIAHELAAQSMMTQVIRDQESRTFDIRQKVSIFAEHVISDANTLANSYFLSDPQMRAKFSVEQQVAQLNDFIDNHPSEKYDSIAVFDLNGNLLFQSKSPNPLDPKENYQNRNYFQRAIGNKAPAVNDPEIHSSSGQHSLEVATPIKETGTGKIIGVVCLRMPLAHWKHIFEYIQAEGWEYRLIDSEGYIFDTDQSQFIGQTAGVDLTDLSQLQAKVRAQIENNNHDTPLTQVMKDQDDDHKALVTLTSIPGIKGLSQTGWQIALSRPVDEAFAPLKKFRLTLLFGTSAAALLVGVLATVLTNRAILPILTATEAVKKIGRGEFNTHLDVEGRDELALLGTNINKMAEKLRALVDYKEAEAERSQRLTDFTLKLSRAINSEEVFQIAVEEVRSALQADRAFFYCLEQDGQGKIIAESVADSWSSLFQAKTTQLEYLNEYIANNEYQFGKVRSIPDIYQANLEINHLKQLAAFNVKAELVAPFSTDKQFQGLLIVHQCNQPRKWQQAEIDFVAQLTSQVVLAWERTNVVKQKETADEQLQQRALELLMEVAPISQGDLTIRATVTEDEIGTLADSYNSTVESLRQIVMQVQKSVTQIAKAISNNEGSAQSLSDRASQQSNAIADALNQIQALAESINTIATNAEEAKKTFQEVLQTVATGDVAMDRTVAGILAIRETVAETAKKVKRLGESSQKICKVVNLIGSFAAQTNLLALNASLEASRAGETGNNFARVAEEIRALAQQSAEATTEIEKIVASIQLDTKEVAQAMEEGTERVVIGTKLVAETRQSLNQVASSSKQVDSRITKIAYETIEQSQVSQEITQTIAEVAGMATTTSKDATQVSTSTKELITVAEELQASVSQFKV
ncbi:MAG: methyl-accepting chemotaxis protein [Xenococcaceae cyanobacterium MO_234.B1]|nr:methyl-accepting chemotaxis protein [Xenococcaceae cyanobacterium MO_234.B1]